MVMLYIMRIPENFVLIKKVIRKYPMMRPVIKESRQTLI